MFAFVLKDAYNNDDLVLYSCTNLIKDQNEKTNILMKKMLQDAGEKITYQGMIITYKYIVH